MSDGTVVDNLFAGGEIMSGNILSAGYLGGFGLTIGTVFGRIAGAQAAAVARG
jgi:tricarballylate dehydrogenase